MVPPAVREDLSESRIVRLRAAAQRLTNETRRRASAAEILREVCGLQAQVLEAAALGLRARGAGLRLVNVKTALEQERSIVRTWLMRGTLHLVAAGDLRWLLGLLGPEFASRNQKRHAELGLTDGIKADGLKAIRSILGSKGPSTRYEIADQLRRFGIDLNARSQAPIHLIAYAALNGVCCMGPERANGEPTYVLIDDWIPEAKTGPTVNLAELAIRYFKAYGPATVQDFAAWSGLPMTQVKAALPTAMKRLEELRIKGQAAYIAGSRHDGARLESAVSVRLLPAFDTYLLGYRSRNMAVPPLLENRLQRGGGWIHPSVVVDGRAIGAWSLLRAGQSRIAIEALARPSRSIRAAIADEVADIARFLDLQIAAEFA